MRVRGFLPCCCVRCLAPRTRARTACCCLAAVRARTACCCLAGARDAWLYARAPILPAVALLPRAMLGFAHARSYCLLAPARIAQAVGVLTPRLPHMRSTKSRQASNCHSSALFELFSLVGPRFVLTLDPVTHRPARLRPGQTIAWSTRAARAVVRMVRAWCLLWSTAATRAA